MEKKFSRGLQVIAKKAKNDSLRNWTLFYAMSYS